VTGKFNVMQLPMTWEQFDECRAKWEAGALIQNAFPMLNAEQREFIMTGITPEEWEATFGPGDA
jgi:hypothetical protein